MTPVQVSEVTNKTTTQALFDVPDFTRQNDSLFANNTSALAYLQDNRNNIESALNSIFPSKKEENKLQRARRILGEVALKLSDEQIEVFATEIQYLLDTWLDDYEKQVFDNKTLKQLLMEE
jgi:S-adenosylmethionine:tRNA-ribosyltransferase-isomerase (queuine synthetase)